MKTKKILTDIYDIQVLTDRFIDNMYKNNHPINIHNYSIKEVSDHLTNNFEQNFKDNDFTYKGWEIIWDLEFIGKDYNLLLSGNLWNQNYFVLKIS